MTIIEVVDIDKMLSGVSMEVFIHAKYETAVTNHGSVILFERL